MKFSFPLLKVNVMVVDFIEFVFFFVAVPPMIWIQNQLVGAYEGQQMTLECHSEAYPKSINYWTRDRGDIIVQGK